MLAVVHLAPARAQAPPNDNCPNATPISGNGTFTFNTTQATTGPEGQNAPNCNSPVGPGIFQDVWYCWTATCTGLAIIDTCGLTNVDTKIAFYTGGSTTACPSCPAAGIAPLCCNDDSGVPACPLQAHISCEVQCCQKYLIQLGSKPGAPGGTGSFSITCQPSPGTNCVQPCPGGGPVNDDCEHRTLVTGGVTLFDTTGATTSLPPVPSSCASSTDPPPFVGNDIWFNYIAPCDGEVTFSLCGSSFNTVLTIYAGCTCPPAAGNLVACNDDYCGAQSQITMFVVQGNCYKLRISGINGQTGTGILTISDTIPPANLVSWWPFDTKWISGSTAFDIAGNFGNNGIINGPVPAPGQHQEALLFSGNNVVTVLDSTSNNTLDFGTGDFSIDAWIRLTTDHDVQPIVDKRSPAPGANAIGYRLYVSFGKLALSLGDPGTPASEYVSAGPSLFDFQWHCVGATVQRGSASGVKLYVDGNVVGTFSSVPEPGSISNSANLLIGAGHPINGPSDYFHGYIDEVEIFSRALAAAEIQAVCNGKCKKCPFPIKCKTWTLDNDFDMGVLTGVNHNSPNNNQLQLDPYDPNNPTFVTPFAWIANSGDGTVSKVDVGTGKEVARYHTGATTSTSPSRTAVDSNGNCWVANRDFGNIASVVEILIGPSTATDRNNNSVIDTSSDVNNNGCIDPSEVLPWGADELVNRVYFVGAANFPTEQIARALTFDNNGFLWVGLWNQGPPGVAIQLDPNLPAALYAPPTGGIPPEKDRVTLPAGAQPYGLARSPNGKLYAATISSTVVEIDPGNPSIPNDATVLQSQTHLGQNYGIAVDRNCIVWLADLSAPRCIRWDPPLGGAGFTYGSGAASRGRGITVDFANNVWMACDLANSVAKFPNALSPVATNYSTCGGPCAQFPVGVGVASSGDIIAVGQVNDTWVKIDKNTGANINTGGPQCTGPNPYSYSDFTGSLSTLSQQQGFWTVVCDAGYNNAAWGTITWNSLVPPGTLIEVFARAGNTNAPTGAYAQVFNNSPFTMSGRYIQIRVRFLRSTFDPQLGCGSDPPPSPVLYDLTLKSKCLPCELLGQSLIADCDPAINGAIVNYPPPIVIGPCDPDSFVCTPPSGSFFPVGTTNVICTGSGISQVVYTVTVPPCPQETGACCVPHLDANQVFYNCVNNVTQADCISQGGLFQGIGSTCTSDTCKFCAPPPLNMVAWWTADGNTTDLTSNGNNGTLLNGAGYAGGVVGQAFNFDGIDDYVRVLDNSMLDFGASTSVPGSGDLSIDAWIRTGTAQGIAPIVDKRSGVVGSTTNPVRGYAFFLFNSNLAFQLSDGIGSASSNYISATPVADGAWHHVAVSVDRDSPTGGRMYVDGGLVFVFNPTGRPGNLSNAADLWIGARQPIATPLYFGGKIDEIEIFSRAITPEEVFAVFSAGVKGKCKESCHLPRAVPCCSLGGPATTAITICNYTNASQTYNVLLSSLPAGAGCTIAGPSGITPSSFSATVPAGTCQAFPITLQCPTGIPVSGGIGCFQAGITNPNTGTVSQCVGTIRPTLKWCIGTPVDCCTTVLTPGSAVAIGFEVTNTGDPAGTLNYQIQAFEAGSDSPSQLVRLNGLPPGTRYIGNLSLAPGESATVPVDVAAIAYEPFTLIDIVLEADLDGDGVYEPLYSQTLRLLPPTLVNLTSANPPAVSPYNPPEKFRDVLQNQANPATPQGIGVPGTPDEANVRFVPILVSFSGTPFPAPTVSNITVDCTDSANNGPADCPTVTSVVGGGSTWFLTLSAPPPPRECITFQFAGAVPGQWLQYQVLPGDVNLDGASNTIDLLWLVQRLNDGSANVPTNRARYNVDRSSGAGPQVNTVDLLRLVQLLNGVNTTQAFNGASAAACP